jgi:hypothetical protein
MACITILINKVKISYMKTLGFIGFQFWDSKMQWNSPLSSLPLKEKQKTRQNKSKPPQKTQYSEK